MSTCKCVRSVQSGQSSLRTRIGRFELRILATACVVVASTSTSTNAVANIQATQAMSSLMHASVNPQSPIGEGITAVSLGELISAHRQRWPAFEVRYTHDFSPQMRHDGQLRSGEMALTYANGNPSSSRATVRSEARVAMVGPMANEPDSCVNWMFDSETGAVTVADATAAIARVSQRLTTLDGNREFENFTGLGVMQSLTAEAPSRHDLVTALRGSDAVLRGATVAVGAYDCLVIDVPIEADTDIADRHTFYVCESLNYAVVALEVVVSDKVWSRRVASEFLEIAPGAPHLPLVGTLWCRGDGTSEISQEIRVLRAADGTPEIRLGADVRLAVELAPGTSVEDLDTGAVRIVSAGWSDGPAAILATLGVPANTLRSQSLVLIASIGALGFSGWVGNRWRVRRRGA
jgi:hypothetical protein